MPATAWIHRRDQLHARGVSHVMIGARHNGAARFQRLAQGFERAALEFRQFVEKQDTVMGERYFAGLGLHAAADQSRE